MTLMQPRNYGTVIVEWKMNTTLSDLFRVYLYAEYTIASSLSSYSLNVQLLACWLTELRKVSTSLHVYLSSVTMLHVACRMQRSILNNELVYVLAVLVGQSIGPSELNTSDLAEFLQKSAAEHLTTFRQLEARDFGSVATIVTADFQVLYMFKRGDYQQCLQLSTQNVHSLLYAVYVLSIPTLPEFIQLLDDDIVSLTALTLIIHPKCRGHGGYVCISQLTLWLYLMTQRQLKLGHSGKSLAQTLDCIEAAKGRHPADCILDQLTMKLLECKVVSYISTLV